MNPAVLPLTGFFVRELMLCPRTGSGSGKRRVMRKKGLKTKGLLTALVIGAVPLLGPGLSFAGTEARLCDDAYTSSANATTNYGAATTLNLLDPKQKSFIKFDLSTLPPGTLATDVKKATLKLFVN